MSQQDAVSFVELLIGNEAFRRDLLTELDVKSEGTVARLIQFGTRRGLSFTESELTEAWKERQKAEQRELTETELEAVAGGLVGESLMASLLTSLANMKHESLKSIAQNLRG